MSKLNNSRAARETLRKGDAAKPEKEEDPVDASIGAFMNKQSANTRVRDTRSAALDPSLLADFKEEKGEEAEENNEIDAQISAFLGAGKGPFGGGLTSTRSRK